MAHRGRRQQERRAAASVITPMPEFDLIARIHARAASRGDVVLGIGDDAAILRLPPDRDLVVAMDTLNTGVHFPEDTAPADIGCVCLEPCVEVAPPVPLPLPVVEPPCAVLPPTEVLVPPEDCPPACPPTYDGPQACVPADGPSAVLGPIPGTGRTDIDVGLRHVFPGREGSLFPERGDNSVAQVEHAFAMFGRYRARIAEA